MKWLWLGLLIVWCLAGSAQFGPGIVGPFTGTSDRGGGFVVDTPLNWRVKGELADVVGKPLPGVTVAIFLEPRAGLAEIVGIGNVEAIWVVVEGFDPARVSEFSIIGGVKPVFDVGRVTARDAPLCDEGTWEVRIIKDDCSEVIFDTRQCTKGRWGWWSRSRARKGEELPEEMPKACTWFVVVTVVTEDKDKRFLNYEFYHSDGKTWQKRVTLKMQIVSARPATGETCQYVVVARGDGYWFLYHCKRPGEWTLLGEWHRPEPATAPEPEPER
jgi:hypothetical protein